MHHAGSSMANSLEPSEGSMLCKPINLLGEALSMNDETRKRALQRLKEMLELPTFIESLTESFHSLDPVQVLRVEEFIVKLLHLMMGAYKHSEVRKMICFLFKKIIDVVKPRNDYFGRLLSAFIQVVQNEDEIIQHKAFKALSTVVEEFPTNTTPYLGSLLETLLVNALSKYKLDNISKMYEVIIILAKNNAGNPLNKPEFIQLLFPSLISQWDELQWNGNDNDELIPYLLECVLAVVKATKTGCLPFCEPLFQRCISLLKNHSHDEDITLTSLELLLGLAKEIGAGIGGLIEKTNIRQLLVLNMQHPSPDIRAASFDLLLELSKTCLDQVIRPYLPDFMPILSGNLIAGSEPGLILHDDDIPSDDDDESPCDVSDTAFSILVKLVLQLGTEMQDYINLLLPRLLALIELQNGSAAIILGRLGLYCSSQVAPFLSKFVHQWCRPTTFGHTENDMKEQSFRGMCQLLTANPSGISNENFILLYNQVSPWIGSQCEGELKQLLIEKVWDFKIRVGEQEWNRLTIAG